jgi:serine/threonine-protein kinase
VPACIVQGLGRKLREARVFGSYALIERIGRGGMGEVWSAKHALLARPAAIKLVRPERLGVDRHHADLILQRFTREAQATAALTSPHTIRVYDFGLTSEGTFYYVMELLDGLDLESLVRQSGPLPVARAMHLVQQICQSLAEAHAKGLIHRDIKPANIFVGSGGLEYDFVKVLDFGLVKRDDAADSTLHTAPAVALGTPGYMAPETIVASQQPDAGVDVYAIGCVAYYLLTGQLVFTGDSPMHVLLQHVQDEPLPPSARSEQHVPAEIDALVMACLRKNPAARPRSALDVLRLVNDVIDRYPWNQNVAQRWWTTHLPQPAAVAMTVEAGVTL